MKIQKSSVFILSLIVLNGCAQMMGSLRRDLNDADPYTSPTMGGAWQERGFLSESTPGNGDVYGPVGHAERGPASGSSGEVSQHSWVSPDQEAANHRDAIRGTADDESVGPTYGNTPNMEPPVKRNYKNGARATRSDFLDESPNEGSLWASDGQTNYYFSKNKVRSIGDILTINIEQEMVTNIAQEVRRGLTPGERDMELAAAQERIRAKAMAPEDPKDPNKDQISTSSAAANRTPSTDAKNDGAILKSGPELEVRQATLADIDVGKSLAIKAGDTMMAEIVDRFPNGNFKIRGTKKIAMKSGSPRLVTLVGVVRGNDISEEDVVLSGKLYEYRLEAIR